ncbi:MAG TPA: hypothetical protein VKH41_03720 [Myxococcota bacterium]|nr:hypothetical protein [Myxococcota bacterium]
MRLRPRSLPWLAAAALLLAGSASALPTTYLMASGSQMSMSNQACTPCTVPVTGSVTLDDDAAGHVALTQVSLAHDPYQVGLPPFVSIVLDRDSIALAAGSAAGAGSTLSSVVFGSASLAHVGTITCTSGIVTCTQLLGIPDGTFRLPSPVTVDLGTWTFDGLGGLSASFVYTMLSGANPATETLTLVGSTTPVPEAGTGLLVAAGLAGVSLLRRARI